MGKLKHIVQQLTETDYCDLSTQLSTAQAGKSRTLFDLLRKGTYSEANIMRELSISTNAYYTLCSRLAAKIEAHLVSRTSTSRGTLLNKVSHIHEIMFSGSRAVVLSALKRLEKELRLHGLSAELLIVYKHLKKMLIHTSESFYYTQQYHTHFKQTMAIDEAEILVADYMRAYGAYFLRYDEESKKSLLLYTQRLEDLYQKYTLDRLYVYYAMVMLFHRIYVQEVPTQDTPTERRNEEILHQVEAIFQNCKEDPIYPHYKLLFDFLELMHNQYYGIDRRFTAQYELISEQIVSLLSHYTSYTFPSHMLWLILYRQLKAGTMEHISEANEQIFRHYIPLKEDVSNYLSYMTYRALSCYYTRHYQEAANWLTKVLNEVSLKRYPRAHIELKSLLALQYVLLDEHNLFTQVVNSLQRLLRLLGKSKMSHIEPFIKILKIALSEGRRVRAERIHKLLTHISTPLGTYYCPIGLVCVDKEFVRRLSRTELVYQ